MHSAFASGGAAGCITVAAQTRPLTGMHLFSCRLALLAGFTALLWGRPICVGAQLLSFWWQHCAAPLENCNSDMVRLHGAWEADGCSCVVWPCLLGLKLLAQLSEQGEAARGRPGCGAEVGHGLMGRLNRGRKELRRLRARMPNANRSIACFKMGERQAFVPRTPSNTPARSHSLHATAVQKSHSLSLAVPHPHAHTPCTPAGHRCNSIISHPVITHRHSSPKSSASPL